MGATGGRIGSLAKRPALLRLTRIAGAASCVDRSFVFAARELRGTPTVASYRLGGRAATAVVRHPLIDMWVLEEIFRHRSYEFPPAVAQAIRELDRPPRVLDLGAHVGLFGLFVLGVFPGARLTSFEPDHSNMTVLARCIAENGRANGWEMIEAAAGTQDGEDRFISDYHLSRSASATESLAADHRSLERIFPFLRDEELLTARETSVRTVDVLPYLRQADLVKIDIQGGEWALLRDPRFGELRARAIVLEYHPGALPNEDAERVVTDRLEGMGYVVERVTGGHDREGLCWGYRRPEAGDDR